MLECCKRLALAWDEVSAVNCKNAWNKLLFNQNWNVYPKALRGDVTSVLTVLQKVPGFANVTFEETKAWIESDYMDCGWEVLNEKEIVERYFNFYLHKIFLFHSF